MVKTKLKTDPIISFRCKICMLVIDEPRERIEDRPLHLPAIRLSSFQGLSKQRLRGRSHDGNIADEILKLTTLQGAKQLGISTGARKGRLISSRV